MEDRYEAGDGMSLAASPVTDRVSEGLTANPGPMFAELVDLFSVGGPVVAILCVLSFFAAMIGIAKLMQFHSVKLGSRATARQAMQLWMQGNIRAASRLAGQSSNPLAQALAHAMHGLERGVPEPRLKEAVAGYCNDALAHLRGWFRPLEVIAALSPLLGLFGTVLGMIEAFQQLEKAGNQVNPAILSGGIWEALLTTAVGLAVAIPVVALLNWLESRVDGLEQAMESYLTRLFTDELALDAEQPESVGEANDHFTYSEPAIAAGE